MEGSDKDASEGDASEPGSDFASQLAGLKFWDKDTDRFFRENGVPIIDRALQNRAEIIELCRFIEREGIRSYHEVGVWTGRLISTLHSIFRFEHLSAVDVGEAKLYDLPLHLPRETQYFEGDTLSPVYVNWRNSLGQIDLVFIDADHTYGAVSRIFSMQRELPHRFIALHGISGSEYVGDGVRRLWNELTGRKEEIILPHADIDSEAPTMGIGIWSEQ